MQCFDGQNYPKVLATSTPTTDSVATAVTAHEGTNALFVGGKLTDPDWIGTNPGMAFVGKINDSTTMWSWQKKLYLDPGLTTITALSVNPAGTHLACYGYDWGIGQ